MPGVDFRQVRASISMVQVLDLLGYPRQRSGHQLRGPCPVHASQSPRSRVFAVDLRRNMYQCFRCGSAGNHLDLYAAVTRQGLHAAALELCQRLKIPVPWLRRHQEARTEKRNP